MCNGKEVGWMTLKELLKNNVPRTILIISLYLIYAVAGALSQYLFKYAIDDITNKNFNGYVYWQILEAVMGLATVIILPIASTLFTRQIQDYLHQIRKDIVRHYYDDSNDEKLSVMQNQLTGNLKLLSTDFATPWITILSGILQILLAFGLLLSMNWILIVTTAILAIITFLTPKIMEKRLRRL